LAREGVYRQARERAQVQVQQHAEHNDNFFVHPVLALLYGYIREGMHRVFQKNREGRRMYLVDLP
jgi:hypothetical protein